MTFLQTFVLVLSYFMMFIVLGVTLASASLMPFFLTSGLVVKTEFKLPLSKWSYEVTHSQWCFHLYHKMHLQDLILRYFNLGLNRYVVDISCLLFCQMSSEICYILVFLDTRNLLAKHLRSVRSQLHPLNWEYLEKRITSEYLLSASHHYRNYHRQLQNF